jgi:hypothetical protein
MDARPSRQPSKDDASGHAPLKYQDGDVGKEYYREGYCDSKYQGEAIYHSPAPRHNMEFSSYIGLSAPSVCRVYPDPNATCTPSLAAHPHGCPQLLEESEVAKVLLIAPD